MKKSLIKYIGLMLLLATLFSASGALLSVTAADPLTAADFGMPDSERNTEVPGSELLKLLFGIEAGEAEQDYIDRSGSFKFTYSDTVPASKIAVKMTDEGLSVTLSNWEYTAQNGETVSWVPIGVTVNGISKSVSGAGEYIFGGEWSGTKDFEISAEYETEFSIDAVLCNTLLNYAYRDAEQKNSELLIYEAEKAEYELSVTKYAEYQKALSDYITKRAYYELYLSQLEEYEKKQGVYEYYLKRLDEYTQASKAYGEYVKAKEEYDRQYAAYKVYESEYKKYSTDIKLYESYIEAMEARRARLALMDSIFVWDGESSTLYATICGPLVDEVLAKRDQIINTAHVDERAVDRAGECTKNLREILGGYNERRDEKDKYLYYEENYENICINFKDLYAALRSFYDNDVVRSILNTQGRTQRYRRFLAHLYVVSTALDDDLDRDSDWRMEVERDVFYYIEDFIDEAVLVPDGGEANPKLNPGWHDELEEPVMPAEVAKPTKPVEVHDPGNPPTEIIKPTAPTAVEEPEKPEEVQKPGARPTPVTMTAAQRSIVEALRNGEISEREEITEDIIVKKTETVSKTIKDLNKHHVRFMNGKDVVFEYEILDGDMLILPEDIPIKADTDEFSYSFRCWVNELGETVSAAPVCSDLDFYSSFTSQRKSYTVTWNVDGVKHTENVLYGTVPEFSGNTDKPMSESKIYTFIGWDDMPERVTGDAEYTALYSETDRLYDITWTVDGVSVTEQYKYSEMPVYKGITDKASDNTYIYTFAGWSPEIAAVSGNASYEAVYSSEKLVLDSMGKPLPAKEENATYVVETDGQNVDITALYSQALKKEYGITVRSKECTMSISSHAVSDFSEKGITRVAVSADENGARLVLCDSSGRVINGGAEVRIEYDYTDETGAKLFSVMGDQVTPLYVEDGKVIFRLTSGQSVKIIKKYSATAVVSEHGDITVSDTLAEAGAEIFINQDRVEHGYIVKEIKVTSLLGGEPVELDAEKQAFIMPVGGVNVEVVYERQTFKVTFVSEGEVISEKTYFLGDDVEIPKAPTKASENDVIYTFSGWTPEIVPVKEDAVYEAIFTETKLADESEMNEQNYENREYELYIFIGAVFVGVGCIIFLSVILVRELKKKRSK